MMKVKYYTCPVCKQKYKTLSGWGDHMDKLHPKERPDGYSTSRFFYMVKTGKTAGKCRTCKGDTLWNESSMKYNQFCENPKCKEAYVKIAKTRMINTYGKEYILNDPDMQKKMMANRKISGKYTFQDGGKIGYVGSYEKKFLMMLDTLFEWPSNDIIGPSPHTYYYDYKNKKYDEKHEGRKFYIPDYYIPSLNLEIEIKQQTSTNDEFNKVNRVKEQLKDEIMKNNRKVNYLKINDNDFRDFFKYLEEVRLQDPNEAEKAMESCTINTELSDSDIAVEACKSVDEARKFVKEVDGIAKKYKANYFIVTDGASATRNGSYGPPYTSNPAVKNARESQKKWEIENGFDPDEDWKKGIPGNQKYYRITYDDRGIYDELKKAMTPIEWRNFLSSDNVTWLPKPPNYKSSNRSYFTKAGYDEFNKKVIPIVNKYLNKNKIRVSTYDNIKNISYSDNFQVVSESIQNETIAMEEAMYSKKNKYPVFIVLQHSGTTLGNIVQKITKDEFSHACISFSPTLAPLYSFGNKKLNSYRDNGFVVQDTGPKHEFYLLNKAYYSVYVMYVDKISYDAMYLRIQYFIDHKDDIKFDLKNLISCYFQIPSEKSKKFFCSRFVAEILNAGNQVAKLPSLYKPQDLSELQNISLVNHGYDFKKYDINITEKNLKLVQKKNFDLINPANESLSIANEETVHGVPVYPSEYKIQYIRYASNSKNEKNGLVKIEEDKDLLRYRSEIIIIKDNRVFINRKNDDLKYSLPGGGVDICEDPKKTAIREAQEEVRMNIANVKYVGTYVKHFDYDFLEKTWKKHHIYQDDRWFGSFTVVFIGSYFSNYNETVDPEDRSNMVKNGEFIPIEDAYKILDPIHKNAIEKYLHGGLENIEPYALESTFYNMKPSLIPATEGFLFDTFFKRNKKENFQESWARKIFDESARNLFGYAFLGKRKGGIRLEIQDNQFVFHGLNVRTLVNRIKKFYEDRSIYELFIPEYNKFDYMRFQKKKMSRSQMRIESLHVDTFFAIELVCLFKDLGERFRDNHYKHIAKMIYNESWLSEADKKAEQTPLLPLNNLKNLDLTLNDYQKDFIQKYPKLKAQLHLKGYILAFEQGLGKTLTAIALSECLNVDHVYIVCPNSLKANWALEIRKYYKKYQDDEDLWRQEVFTCSDRPSLFSDHTTKFIITNNESIEKMFPYVMSGKNMLILDESHNFRNIDSKRVSQLLDLRDRLKCTDSLIMSGTPIKATPDEIVPALMMIDPTFSLEAAKTFTKAFKLRSSLGTSLVQARFEKIMFRKEKDVLGNTLPQKFVSPLPLKISNWDRYLMSSVNEIVQRRFSEIYEEGYSNIKKLEPEFLEMSRNFQPVGYEFSQFKRIMNIRVNKDGDVHELDATYSENYMIKAKERMKHKPDRDRYDYLIKNYARYMNHCLGLAFGEILPPYRRDMFISLYEENRDYFIRVITSNPKKTLIFSQFKGVAQFIHKDLNENGVGAGLITGDVKDRLEVLKDFKENDQTEVLVATSQTIGTGVTLIEANQLFFFGPPWRDSDFAQCSDRIHRIGQTDDCYIYTVTLDTGEALNLSTRMDNILQWSKQMTESVIKSTDDDKNIDETEFEKLLKASESTIISEFLSEKEENPMEVTRRLPGCKFHDLVIEKFTPNYRLYRAVKLIPENTIILDNEDCLEAKEIKEFAKYGSTTVPNVAFESCYSGIRESTSLITTRSIKIGEFIRLPKIDNE